MRIRAACIWIGFTGSGLDRFDPTTGTFTHFRHQANDTGSIASDIVSALLIDHLGNFWVGTNGGLDLFDRKTGRFKHFINNDQDSASLSDSIVRAIYEDHEGTLWIGTGFPWAQPSDRGGLNRFNRETGTFTRFLHDPKNPHSLANNKVRALFEDSRGNFWVGTGGGDGLHTMDRKTGVFKRYPYNPAKPEQLSRLPIVNNIGDHITFITEDALGNLWIGTFGNGLIRYDTATKKITRYGANADGTGTFTDNSGWWANTSKDGLIWISTQEAHLYRVDIFTNYFPRFETAVGPTNAFYQEDSDLLWLGTFKGLIRKDTRNGTSRRFINESVENASKGANSINGIIKDKQGDFLISSYGGISRFNPKTSQFTRFEVDSGIRESIRNDVGCLLYMDSRSNLWFGTNDALHFWNRETGEYIHYNNVLNDSNSVSTAAVAFMLEEDNGLWVGTYYAGLSRLNRQTGKFRHYLSVAYTTSIYKDLKGIIWVGTKNGLYRYNRQSDTFSLFGEGNAGIKIDNVSALIGDNQDNLWIASASGIYRINQARDQVILYDKKNGIDGFTSQLYWGVSAYKGRDGEIFFSSSSGYYAFYPDKIKIPAGSLNLEFSKLWLKGLEVKANPDGPLTKPLSETKEIRLNYDQNVFSLGFVATDYGDPEDETFYYNLENYEEVWRLSGVDRKAYYFNVPPGKYIFRVRASNNSNGATAEKAISVIISPPWWQTWWAYSIYALLVVMAVISVVRIQKKKVLRKARELGRERELEMQALRAQMNPHFIFNCLSSINNFVLKNETEEASDYLTKFSRLIRTVLNNSKKSFIPLEDELEMLRLYLEMETLRFKNSFTYCIHTEENIDPDAIFIPPLLIQPFVENAIWHGLLHKEDPGRLDITVKVEKNILICVIEDNGVGRSRARTSESKSVETKKSMGIQITRQRLSLINGNAEIAGNDFVIEDLFDDFGHAAGTKVILRLMYKEINDEII